MDTESKEEAKSCAVVGLINIVTTLICIGWGYKMIVSMANGETGWAIFFSIGCVVTSFFSIIMSGFAQGAVGLAWIIYVGSWLFS